MYRYGLILIHIEQCNQNEILFTGNCGKVTYYISGSITFTFLKFCIYTTIVGHILPLILIIILVHLKFEMPPKKNETFSHQHRQKGPIYLPWTKGFSLTV